MIFRKSLAFIFCFTIVLYSATYYVDAVSGDNGNDGLSPRTAWKNHYNVVHVIVGDNSFSGDTIRYRADSTNPNQVFEYLYLDNSSHKYGNITFTSYDSLNGDTPCKARFRSTTSGWTAFELNKFDTCHISNIQIDTSVFHGFKISESKRVYFNNTEAKKCLFNGFTIYESDTINLDSCTADSNKMSGIRMYGIPQGGGDTLRDTTITIKNSRFYYNTYSGITGSVVDLTIDSDTTYLNDSTTWGMYNMYVGIKKGKITNCIVHDTRTNWFGIKVIGGDIEIKHNKIWGCTTPIGFRAQGPGQYYRNITIDSNEVWAGQGGYGIDCMRNPGIAWIDTVTHDTVYHTTEKDTIHNVKIRGNHIHSCDSSANGIYLSYIDSIEIKNNILDVKYGYIIQDDGNFGSFSSDYNTFNTTALNTDYVFKKLFTYGSYLQWKNYLQRDVNSAFNHIDKNYWTCTLP